MWSAGSCCRGNQLCCTHSVPRLAGCLTVWLQWCPLHLSHLRGIGTSWSQTRGCTPLKENSQHSQSDFPSGTEFLLRSKAALGTAPPGEAPGCNPGCSRTNAEPCPTVMHHWGGCCHTGEAASLNPCTTSSSLTLACGPQGSQQENSGILTRWMVSQDELCDELGVIST